MEKPNIIYQINDENDCCTNILFCYFSDNIDNDTNSYSLYNINSYLNTNNDIELFELKNFYDS